MSAPKPTAEQEAAIDYPDSMVAIAKPGSGKTFVLSHKIANALDDAAVYRGVIAISYTNKASEELRNRVATRKVNISGSFFGTIDKFCYGEISIPFLKHVWGSPKREISIVRLRDLPARERVEFGEIEENQIDLKALEGMLPILKSRYLEGELFLEASGALALYTLNNSKACRRYLRARYSHIFIDEYQDSGLEQHELFLRIQEIGLIAVAVGDADQSIFGFSNKDSKYLLSLAKDKNFKSFPITFNHRCHPSIINYSLMFIANEPESVTLQEADEIRVLEKFCQGGASEIVKWIEKALPGAMKKYGVAHLNEVAILVRSGASGDLVSNALKMDHKYFVGHPLEENFSLWSGLFVQLLTFRYNQRHTIQDIVDRFSSRLRSAELAAVRKAVRNLRKCRDSELFGEMIDTARLLLPNAEKEEPVRMLEQSNVEDLARIFRPAKENEIQVMSLHKSKGLEFDLVFHLDLYEWVLPTKRPGPGNDFDNPVYPSWDQDSNLHYVGITRAKKVCVLCHSSRRMNSDGDWKNGRPSEFLLFEGAMDLKRKLADS